MAKREKFCEHVFVEFKVDKFDKGIIMLEEIEEEWALIYVQEEYE